MATELTVGNGYYLPDLVETMVGASGEAGRGLRIGCNSVLGTAFVVALKSGVISIDRMERYVLEDRARYDQLLDEQRRARSEHARKAAKARWAKAEKKASVDTQAPRQEGGIQ